MSRTRILIIFLLLQAGLLTSAISYAQTFDVGSQKVIKVGLRSDARPFSYTGASDDSEFILENYRGFMVEICRSVLRDMVSSGPFDGYRVEVVEINAGNRFSDLANGKVDMLCGPDSITSSRLRDNNVSYPMFLSGMTYGYIDPNSPLFPRGKYCGHVVGVVGGTTAATQGLEMLADQNLLLRFDKPLELYLARYPVLIKGIRAIIETTRAEHPDLDFGAIDSIRQPLFAEFQTSIKQSIVTDECPNGFINGLPVRKFKNHDDGIEAFCTGEVIYYIGDYDIIQRKIEAYSNCPAVMERFTSTREVYGAFFRKGFDDSSAMTDVSDLEADLADKDERSANGKDTVAVSEPGTDSSATAAGPASTGSSSDGIRIAATASSKINDALLYAVFNHTLLSKMQADVDILEYEFKREFGNSEKSDDLQNFFDSLKIASDL